MYKLKYYSLSSKEKLELKNEFYQTEFGHKLEVRLNRLLVIGILSFAFSIFLFITNTMIWDIVTGILLLIASFIFIIGSFKIRAQKLNDYLIKKNKVKK